MNDRTRLVLRGFLELSRDEQAELMRELSEVVELSEFRKGAKSREISMELGPISRGCPCCGR